MHVSSIIRSKIVVKIVDTGPSSTYSRIPSPQRFPSTLQMKPVPFYDGISDGRWSFGFSWSLLSSFLLFLSPLLSTDRLYVALLLPSNLSFFSPTRNTGPRKRYTLGQRAGKTRRSENFLLYRFSMYRSLIRERIRGTNR